MKLVIHDQGNTSYSKHHNSSGILEQKRMVLQRRSFIKDGSKLLDSK